MPLLGSLILTHDINGVVPGLKDFPPEDRAPTIIPFFTFRNNMVELESQFGWLVNYLETITSFENWATPTVATIAYEYRRIMTTYALLTGTSRPSGAES